MIQMNERINIINKQINVIQSILRLHVGASVYVLVTAANL